MKIIFVNRFFYPDHSATSQMLSDLAFALAADGHNIHVITSRLTYEGGRTLSAREIVKNVTVKRIATTAFGRAGLLGRTLDYLTFYLSASLRLALDVQRGDIVVVKTDPPALSILAAPVTLLKRGRYINWLQDLFPEVATALGMGGSAPQKWGFALVRWLRDLTLRHAETNVVLGERMATRLKNNGVPEQRIQIIANWADGNLIKPVERAGNFLRKEWELEDAFVVGYSGNLGRAHDIKTFLTAIAALEARQAAQRNECCLSTEGKALSGDGPEFVSLVPAIRWLFIGGGAQMAQLKSAVHDEGLKSVLFRPYQPREQLSISLSAPDVHVVSLRPELEGLIVPSKYYGMTAAGRPSIFVGDPEGELAQIIKNSNTGFVVREGDSAGLVDTILKLAKNQELAVRQGARARLLFESKYELACAVSAWKDLIRKASLNRHRPPSTSPAAIPTAYAQGTNRS